MREDENWCAYWIVGKVFYTVVAGKGEDLPHMLITKQIVDDFKKKFNRAPTPDEMAKIVNELFNRPAAIVTNFYQSRHYFVELGNSIISYCNEDGDLRHLPATVWPFPTEAASFSFSNDGQQWLILAENRLYSWTFSESGSAAGLLHLAGGIPGYVDASGPVARLRNATTLLWCSSGAVYIADTGNNRIRFLGGSSDYVPTESQSHSVTVTVTPAPTESGTDTPTVTPADSATRTFTITPPPTSSPTFTPTVTPPPTSTVTLTVTPAPTPSPTFSPTFTSSSSLTHTTTVTPPPTASATFSSSGGTPSVSASPSPTSSVTATQTLIVLTPTATAELTTSHSFTLTPEATETVTFSTTATRTTTATQTPSLTPAATLSKSARTQSSTISTVPTSSQTDTISPPDTGSPTETRSLSRMPTPSASTAGRAVRRDLS
jgi:hypothetical protein